MPITLTQLNEDEALRYMGCPPEKADAPLRALVSSCAREVLAAAQPRWTWRALDLTFGADGVRLEGGLLLPGHDLREHLAGCDRAAVFCATLGAEVDTLIRRAERLDIGRALALDCCASAGVEALCDQIEGELRGQFPGCSFPFRFSPGLRRPAPGGAGRSAGPVGRPPAGGAVRQQQPPAHPPQVGDRHSGGRPGEDRP